jgi:tungstate transport system substrate-binding protein
MYNDFVLVGPRHDPAGVRGMDDAAAALAKIATTESVFASRADDSGTHKAEVRLWKAAGVDPVSHSGDWYLETGSGMGKTLNVASELDAYVLADRGTWLSFGNRGQLEVLVEGDSRLFNPYGAILVNPERHPHVKADEGRAFIRWLVSEQGRSAIAGFRLAGETLFHPAGRPMP